MTDKIEHAGVLGMHWNVRMGRHSTSKGHKSGSHEPVKVSTASADAVTAAKIKKKKISEMSNEEIRTLTSRMKLEQEYRTLNPSKIAMGRKIATQMLLTAGQQKLQDLTTKNFSAAMNAAINKTPYKFVT